MLLHEIFAELNNTITCAPLISKIVLNGGFTGAVLENGQMGLAMNVRSGACSSADDKELLLSLIDTDALKACSLLLEKREEKAAQSHERFMINSVIVAIMNALSSPYLTEERLIAEGFGLRQEHPEDLVGKDDVVTIVGYGGMVRTISALVRKCFVTELEPEIFSSWMFSANGIVKGPYCTDVVSALESEKYISLSNKVFVTGCALVTDTLDELLALSQGREIFMYGYTAAVLPRVLFSHGVTAIHTVRIEEAENLADLLMNCGGAVERFIPQTAAEICVFRN